MLSKSDVKIDLDIVKQVLSLKPKPGRGLFIYFNDRQQYSFMTQLCNYYKAHHWPDEFKSVRLYFSESFVAGKSHDELEDSANDKRKSGGRLAACPRSRNDIVLRRPSLTEWALLPLPPWRSSSRFKFWFSTFRSLTSFCISDTHTHTHTINQSITVRPTSSKASRATRKLT